jgi:hypothetical protein
MTRAYQVSALMVAGAVMVTTNFAYQVLGPHNWDSACERSAFQVAALLVAIIIVAQRKEKQ